MIEEKIGMITGIKTVTKNALADDGTKIKIPLTEVKIESSDIDYSVIEQYFPNIYNHLNINGARNVIDSAKFDCKEYNLLLKFFRKPVSEENEDDIKKYIYLNITLDQFAISYRENVPTYTLILLKAVEKEDYYISNANKVNIIFTLEKMIVPVKTKIEE